MNLNTFKRIIPAGIFAGILVSGAVSCVLVDTSLGHDYMPLEQQYDNFTCEWELEDVSQKSLAELSGYSSRRFTIGSIRDSKFGLTRKSTAFSLIPANDTLDFGTNPEALEFHFSSVRDTFNVVSQSQIDILQNVNVYAFEDSGTILDSLSYLDQLNNSVFAGKERITKGVPVYDGGDSLSFNFSLDFSNKLLKRFVSNSEDGVYILDTIPNYLQNIFPGIYISTDDAQGYGGRIDMFGVAMDVESGYVMGNYAELKFRSTYDGEQKDTSFLFLFGALSVPESSSDLPDQYAFNFTEIEGGMSDGLGNDILYVEGGAGVKPVVSGKEIYTLLHNEFVNNENVVNYGIDLNQIIITKASIDLPFVMPDDYNYMEAYPEILSPCCRLKSYDSLGVASYTYANLTDASISAESHGEVDRSNLKYSGDISFHAQKMMSLSEPADTTLSNYDVWFLITKNEINETSSSSSSSSSYSDYLNQLYYYNYLNQLYGGYSSYGYSSSSYGYSNYYSLMLYASMLSSSSSSSTSSTSEELDRDRFYGATLCGPSNADRKPKLRVTYSVPKRATE